MLEQHGRIYVAVAEEVVQDAVVIAGTLLIHFAHAIRLFDFGDRDTFISKTLVNIIGVL